MLNKTLCALFIAVGLVGCASVPMGDAQKDQQLKSFAARPDSSGIYIYRNESMGAAVGMNVTVDGYLLGKTGAHTYLYKEVPPGKHVITSAAENTDSIEITTAPGKLYYIWQEVKMGLLYARTKLHLVGEEEGRKGVRESALAESR